MYQVSKIKTEKGTFFVYVKDGEQYKVFRSPDTEMWALFTGNGNIRIGDYFATAREANRHTRAYFKYQERYKYN